MATDRPKKKPTPKRRPTPKVAGRTSLPPEVRGAKAAGLSERSESKSTSLEGPGDEPRDATTANAESAEPETPTNPDPTNPDPTKPDLTKPKAKPVARVSTLRRGDSSASGTPTTGTTDGPARRRAGRRSNRRGSGARNFLGIRTGVLAAVAAGLFVVAAILAFHPGAEIGPNKAFVDQESTAQLTSQAQERICAVFGYDHTELDEWQKRAQDALTGQARTEFDETLKAQRELITQTKTGAECRVDAIGVRDLSGADDGATATVIANLVVSETQNSMATNSGAPRAQFAMVREGDQWRIRAVEPF
ncbi:hypothetical protein GTC6_21525 [Gordonia terrae C-6]|uniref:Mce-associated membrane protein n=1 Tax=Gordonia terrae C-6 TaxID=1316928 RepID=R7Y3P6_9ACTN|nr:hypothetical protein [Gordonia terrae]EON30658.1 hypothetical protein GTC6_21525 [Gordonia terrae C-6]